MKLFAHPAAGETPNQAALLSVCWIAKWDSLDLKEIETQPSNSEAMGIWEEGTYRVRIGFIKIDK